MARYLKDTITNAVTVYAADDDVTFYAAIAQKQSNGRPKYQETNVDDPDVTLAANGITAPHTVVTAAKSVY